jgi:hypothetical protein
MRRRRHGSGRALTSAFALTSAPLSIRRSAATVWSLLTAQCSGVDPCAPNVVRGGQTGEWQARARVGGSGATVPRKIIVGMDVAVVVV